MSVIGYLLLLEWPASGLAVVLERDLAVGVT